MSRMLKRYVNDNFYMEAIVEPQSDNDREENGRKPDRIIAMVGCTAKVEMCEMNMVHITTTFMNSYFTIGQGVEWLSDEGAVIPTIEELVLDFGLYCENVQGFADEVDVETYLDEYEDNVNRLPEPLKQFLIKIIKEDK